MEPTNQSTQPPIFKRASFDKITFVIPCEQHGTTHKTKKKHCKQKNNNYKFIEFGSVCLRGAHIEQARIVNPCRAFKILGNVLPYKKNRH